MKDLIENRQGVVVGMVVMIASIFCVAILFAVSMPAAGLVWDSVMPLYPAEFLPQATQTMNMINTVSGVTLIVLVIGCIIYGFALAHRRDPIDMPG